VKRSSAVVLGIVLIIIGVVFGINALGIADIDLFFDGWWTLFIIVPCVVGLVKGKEIVGNIVGIVIGVMLFLSAQDIFDLSVMWKLIVPLIIVLIGLKLIFRDAFDKKAKELEAKLRKKSANGKEYCSTFSGQNLNFAGEVFDGASLTAVFGGIKCDLRGAVIQEDVIVEVCCVFGGVDVIVPDNVNVKVSSTSIFGGISDKRSSRNVDGAVTVYIKGTCLFGGADIK